MHSLPWITIFGSLVTRFANDFHSWLRHSWKSLANRLTRYPKIAIHGNSCIILYIWHVIRRKCKNLGIPKERVFSNSLRPRQNGRNFADDTFKRIFFNENAWISIKISLKFVPKGAINIIPAMFRIMAWRHPGDKPLSEAMPVSLLMHKPGNCDTFNSTITTVLHKTIDVLRVDIYIYSLYDV